MIFIADLGKNIEMSQLDFAFDKTLQRRAWGIIDQYFFRLGLRLERGHDFDLIDNLAEQNGLPKLEGHFSPALNTYTPSQAFWLALFDEDGLLVGRVCARLDVIDFGSSLTEFWRRYFSRCYPNAEGGQVRLSVDQPRAGRRIAGKVSYLGGCVVHPSWRKRKLGGLLTQMAQIDAFDTWEAGYYYGWVEGYNFMDGFWRDCGFTKAAFHAIRWEPPLPDTLDANLIFVGSSADDIADLIELTVRRNAVQLSDRKAAQTLHLSETTG